MALITDAGALIAFERGTQSIVRRLETARREGVELRTSAIIIGQVWRGGTGKQVPLARLLTGVVTLPVDLKIGHANGVLIGRAGTSDPIDAAAVLAARPGDTILTSDPTDIAKLIATGGTDVFVLVC